MMVSESLVRSILTLKEKSSGKSTNLPLASDAEIIEVERFLGFELSDDHKFFLKNASNIFYGQQDIVYVGSANFYGNLQSVVEEARALGLPHDWLPISVENGNYYCVCRDGMVRYFSLDGEADESWESIADWVDRVWVGEACS